ncbi:hypothetical protein N0V91_002836 [Didymella pomorum]|jgi:hypothetical protein|uniref:Uncharacterized protein n=1 Tax=Didymella pomorum TaxID=749634 RepID=A0A9W8ZHN4_9PLEO|nr:hypothetical protein N0V91_002836 [Didymella pomorum]
MSPLRYKDPGKRRGIKVTGVLASECWDDSSIVTMSDLLHPDQSLDHLVRVALPAKVNGNVYAQPRFQEALQAPNRTIATRRSFIEPFINQLYTQNKPLDTSSCGDRLSSPADVSNAPAIYVFCLMIGSEHYFYVGQAARLRKR